MSDGNDEQDGDIEAGHGASDSDSPAGEIAGGVETTLEGVADLLGDGEGTADAREALEGAAEIAAAAEAGARTMEALTKAGTALQGGEIGGGLSSIGNALGGAGSGLRSLTSGVGDTVGGDAGRVLRDVGRVANTVGQVARGLGQLVDGASELMAGLLGGRQSAQFELEIDGVDIQFTVRRIALREALDQLYQGAVEATFEGEAALDDEELLSKDVSVTIERGDERRHFRGVIRHAAIQRRQEHHLLQLDVVPALWLLEETRDSRVYQDLSVPDLVEQVIHEVLGSRNRTVKRELAEDYQPHEYLVQHRESHFHFIARLMREEGIFFYFDHDEDEAGHEVLVLADSNNNRPLVRPDHDGVVEYEEEENRREGREVAYHVQRQRRVGASDAVVHGFDWTNPALQVHHERTERADWSGPRLEIYDHHHAVRHHGYDDGGGSYQSHTADRQSRLRTERLDLARTRWNVSTTVVSAQPGHVFELQGADLHDGRYLIVWMTATGVAEQSGGTYHNTLNVIPMEMPYRPSQHERPAMPGPETATVVGPAGEEIHTDRHGRIKVQFHWDRQGQNDEHSSAWIRVTQSWAGPGWGFVFIPRIGMEVIVSFLGGDPDRPIVTGCVYNGSNTPPYPLPDEKTKSTIKTNSSLGGGGSNELRFEDKAGSEEVYIHAQKDFNEVVEHNHSTHVKNDQTNTVDHDQTETVKHDQTLTVNHNRKKTVKVDEDNVIKGNRTTLIGPDGGDDSLIVTKSRVERIDGPSDDLYVTSGNKTTTVAKGKWDVETKGEFKVTQNAENQFCMLENAYLDMAGRVQLKAGHGDVHYDAKQGGLLQIASKANTEVKADGDFVVEATNIKLYAKQNIQLLADAEVIISVGNATITVTPSEIDVVGPTVKINASAGNTEIDAATQVKIKC